MRSQAEAIAWVKNSVGKRHVRAHGYTNPYGAQCLAYIAVYTEFLGYGSIMPGYNAIDIWTQNPQHMQRVATPKPGDIHTMDFFSGGKNYGHDGVVLSVSGGTFVSVDQNWFNPSLYVGSPAARVTHQVNQVRGFLRPKFSEGDDMKITLDQLHKIMNLTEGRDANAEERIKYAGKWELFDFALARMSTLVNRSKITREQLNAIYQLTEKRPPTADEIEKYVGYDAIKFLLARLTTIQKRLDGCVGSPPADLNLDKVFAYIKEHHQP